MKKEEAFKVGIPYFAATLYSYSPSVSLYKIMFSSIYFQEEIDCLKRDYEQVLQKLQNAEKETARYKAELESTQENEKKLKNDLKERIKSKQQLRLVVLLVPLRCPQYSCKCLNYANWRVTQNTRVTMSYLKEKWKTIFIRLRMMQIFLFVNKG